MVDDLANGTVNARCFSVLPGERGRFEEAGVLLKSLAQLATRPRADANLLGDRAVHARGGQRSLYEPVVMVAGEPIQPGHAPDLARAYVDRLGLDEIYVADLTAIAASLERSRHRGRTVAEPPRHASTLDGITASGVVVWLDAGIATPEDARHAMHLGATRVVVGLETLPSWKALEEICHLLGAAHVAFSLDLRDGAPVSSLHLVSGRTRPRGIS